MKIAMKHFTPNPIVAILLFTTVSFAAEQSQYQANFRSITEAIAKGEVGAALSAMEVQAGDAVAKRDWIRATWSYIYACYAAGMSGQLQKAIYNATKAIA